MPARKKKASRSGPNISEDQRGTERCTLRVPRGYLEKLDALVTASGRADRGTLVAAWIAEGKVPDFAKVGT